jgi:signal transduction histidine kinase
MSISSLPEQLIPDRVNFKSSADIPDSAPTISPNLQTTLQLMVGNLVDALRCVGAIVTVLGADNTLSVQAYSINVSASFIAQLSDRFDRELLGPKMAIKLDDNRFKNNLGVRAIQGQDEQPARFLASNSLHDVFRPKIKQNLADLAQELAGIEQVIAVPFYQQNEVVGCLFAASGREFSLQDINYLTAFSHQATTAIQTQQRLVEIQALERVILSVQASITDETQTLQTIVDAVVKRLGYAGAIVATLEPDHALPVRAYCIDIPSKILQNLEDKAGLGLLSPGAVVYIDDEKFKDNLAFRAMRGGNGRPEKFVVSDRLYDLFRPIVGKEISNLAQKLVGIQQVIAVPFFLEDEVVGNIFVATRRSHFTNRETELLAMFGQQAAVSIRNARLYKKAEERRQIAQMFAKMAFGATANIHALRNHIGAFQAYVRLIELTSELSDQERIDLLNTGPNILNQLNQAADILDNLHRPWRQAPDAPTDVNTCLTWAIRKVFSRITINADQPETDTGEGVIIHRQYAETLPFVHTSPDMLIEAFRVIVKNAVEAIQESDSGRNLWVESRVLNRKAISITIRDDGIGIEPHNLNKIFEIGWSSKAGQGMGFGLFWAKDYIEGLNGAIKAQSTRGEGTTFKIVLPASSHTN